MSRRIFIDLGAYKGDTIEIAKRVVPPFDIYIGFEPVLSLFKKAKDFHRKDKRVTIVNAAASTSDSDNMEFYLSLVEDKVKKGSSFFQDKVTGDMKKTTCKSVDFSRFLSDLVQNDDFVFLKVDIEGAEYDLLEKMLDDGSIKLVSALRCEFHQHKIPSIPISRHNSLLDRLSKEGVNIVRRIK